MYEIVTETTFDDHVQAEALEKLYLPPQIVATPEVTWAWGKKNAEGLFLLREHGSSQLLGHLSAFPLRRDAVSALIAGEIDDTQLSAADVLPYGSDVPADLYFAVMCVHEAHRREGSRILFSHFVHFLKEKAAIGQCSAINDLFAEAATPAGQRFIERCGCRNLTPEHPLPCYYKLPLADFIKRNAV